MAITLPPDAPATPRADGLALALRVTPNASRDEVCGVRAWGDELRLTVKVRAVAGEGRANAAVRRLIADWLGLPLADVRLVAGQRSRFKTVVAEGESDALIRRLTRALDAL